MVALRSVSVTLAGSSLVVWELTCGGARRLWKARRHLVLMFMEMTQQENCSSLVWGGARDTRVLQQLQQEVITSTAQVVDQTGLADAVRAINNLATAQVRKDTPSHIDVKSISRPNWEVAYQDGGVLCKCGQGVRDDVGAVSWTNHWNQELIYLEILPTSTNVELWVHNLEFVLQQMTEHSWLEHSRMRAWKSWRMWRRSLVWRSVIPRQVAQQLEDNLNPLMLMRSILCHPLKEKDHRVHEMVVQGRWSLFWKRLQCSRNTTQRQWQERQSEQVMVQECWRKKKSKARETENSKENPEGSGRARGSHKAKPRKLVHLVLKT